MSAAHTPGPWVVSVVTDHDGPPACDEIQVQGIVGDTWQRLCEFYWSESGKRIPLRRMDAMANARLIAASPDMLQALRMAQTLKQVGGMLPGVRELIDAILEDVDAAIAKATGVVK